MRGLNDARSNQTTTGAFAQHLPQSQNDPWFWKIVQLTPWNVDSGPSDTIPRSDRLEWFLQAFNSSVDFRYATFRQGGWAGSDDDTGAIVLALAPWSLCSCWRAATAAHELIHLARHTRGLRPFNERLGRLHRWREEFIVHCLAMAYAPLAFVILLSTINTIVLFIGLFFGSIAAR